MLGFLFGGGDGLRRGLLFRLPHEQSHLESVHELGVHVVVVPADTECLREGSQNVRLADFLCFGIDHVVHVATGGVFHMVNDVTLSARTRTDTDDYLVFLDYLHLRVRGSRSE